MKKFLEIIKFLIERFSANNKVTMEKCAECAECAEKELKENDKVTPVTQTVQKKRRGRPRKQRG